MFSTGRIKLHQLLTFTKRNEFKITWLKLYLMTPYYHPQLLFVNFIGFPLNNACMWFPIAVWRFARNCYTRLTSHCFNIITLTTWTPAITSTSTYCSMSALFAGLRPEFGWYRKCGVSKCRPSSTKVASRTHVTTYNTWWRDKVARTVGLGRRVSCNHTFAT